MKDTLEIKLENANRVRIGISCCICEDFIPIGFQNYPDKLCGECKKRLKELLYPTAEMEKEQ